MEVPFRRRQFEPVLHSTSPYNSSYSAAFASSTSTFAARTPPAAFFQRSASATAVSISGAAAASSVRLSLDRSISGGRSLSGAPRANHATILPREKRICMCSPTSHAGSFRCGLHKKLASASASSAVASYAPPNRLNARRSAMTNSLVRIGGVEGDLVKRALAALIRPSSHHQRHRNGFRPRRSRLSVMTKAEYL